jgi:hypothetical protein
MSSEPQESVSQLRTRAGTARRLASQLTATADRDKLLQFAAELEAKADRIESRRKPGAED